MIDSGFNIKPSSSSGISGLMVVTGLGSGFLSDASSADAGKLNANSSRITAEKTDERYRCFIKFLIKKGI